MSKIFIIEDDPFLNKALTIKLKKEGFETDLAIDGIEAIEKLKGDIKPDLILLDLMLPKKSGFEVLKEMKNIKGTEKIPVLIMSNLGQEDDIKRGLDLGAIDYLVKANVKMEDIIKKIRGILKI